MKFEQALEAMRNGKHVKREHWNHPEPSTLFITSAPGGKAIAISPCEGVFSTWLPGYSDLLAEDWQVFGE